MTMTSQPLAITPTTPHHTIPYMLINHSCPVCVLPMILPALSSSSQYAFYLGGAATVGAWKTQPEKVGGVGDHRWWSAMRPGPVQASKSRAPHHRLFTMVGRWH